MEVPDLPYAGRVRWTSLQAYAEILDDLPRRRLEVLTALIEYFNSCDNSCPTAQELRRFMNTQGEYDFSAIESCWKRLPELADEYNAAHRFSVRVCGVTGRKAMTWHPGPRAGTQLGVPRVDPKLVGRVRYVIKNIPTISVERLSWVLGVGPRRLLVAIKAMNQDKEMRRRF